MTTEIAHTAGKKRLRLIADQIELPEKYQRNIGRLLSSENDVTDNFSYMVFALCQSALMRRTFERVKKALPRLKDVKWEADDILSEEGYERAFAVANASAKALRVTPASGGFTLTIPVARFNPPVRTIQERLFQSHAAPELSYFEINNVVESAFNDFVTNDLPELFTVNQPVNKLTPFTSEDYAFSEVYLTERHINRDLWNILLKSVKGWRVLAPPLANGLANYFKFFKRGEDGTYKSTLITSYDQLNAENFSKEEKSEIHEEFTNKVLGYRAASPEGYDAPLVGVDLFIPTEVAVYLTQSERPSAAYMAVWAANWVGRTAFSYQFGTGTDVIKPITAITKEVDQAHESVRQPRTNKDGLAVDTNGDLVIIPVADNTRVRAFSAQYESMLQGEDGTAHFINYLTLKGNHKVIGDDSIGVEKVSRNHTLPNRVIYTDWLNRKLAYTDGSGLFDVEDLEGFVPAGNADILSYIDTTFDASGRRDTFLRSTLIPYLSKLVSMVEHEDMDSFIGGRDEFDYLLRLAASSPKTWLSSVKSSVIGSIRDNPEYAKKNFGDAAMDLMSDAAWTYRLITTNSPVSIFRPLARLLKAESEALHKDVMGYFDRGEYAVPNEMRRAAILTMFGKYIPEYENIFKEDRKERALYLKQEAVPDDYKPRETPLVENLSLSPHQVKADFSLSLGATANILAIDAGGGKTIIIVNDILNKLKEGKFKLPLVLCPGFLIQNYIEDCNFATKGKLNVIPITTDTLRTYGEDFFIALANSKLPKNTILISDFDYLRSSVQTVTYGTSRLRISRNAELLRLFGCDGVYIDESHYLANQHSQRTQSVQRVTADIRYKTLATGTFLHGQLTDVQGQYSLISPSLFGNKQDFIDKYADTIVYGKPTGWKLGAEEEIARFIRTRSVMVTIKKKEWAALLPGRKERFLIIENMTENQKSVYLAILKETIEEIKKNADLMAKFNSKDEGEAENIEFMLRPYLQRLEMFLTAPAMDDAGSKALVTADDRVGPKAKKIAEIIREHYAQNIPGKIVVFTSYLKSARAIYEALPPDLKAQAILYFAQDKTKYLAQFKKDDNKRILLGVETSLNTGLNLQFVSRLIRCEAPWTPGVLEQGESRFFRPDPKTPDSWKRTVYLDWLAVNLTLDITKIARLVSKQVVKAKFDNLADPKYQKIPPLDLVPMTLDTILTMNSFNDTLEEYLTAFTELRRIQREEFKEYREKTKHLNPTPMRSDVSLEDSGFLSKVPYIQGMRLAHADKLGIMALSEYAIEHGQGDERDIEVFDPTGKFVHTEYGDGQVVSARSGSVRVKLHASGKSVTVSKLKVFVILGTGEAEPVRVRLRKLTGLKGVLTSKLVGENSVPDQQAREVLTPNTKPIDREDDDNSRVEKPIAPNNDTKLDGKVNMYLSIVNNTIALGVDPNDPDVDLDMVKRAGFKATGKYLYAHIKTFYAYSNFITLLKKHFKIDKEYLKQLSRVEHAFAKGKARLFDAKLGSVAEINNFYLHDRQQVPLGEIRPYPVVQDGELYVMFTLQRQPSALKIRSLIKVPGVTYEVDAGAYWMFFTNKETVKKAILTLRDRGMRIRNMRTLQKSWSAIRLTKPVDAKTAPEVKPVKKAAPTTPVKKIKKIKKKVRSSLYEKIERKTIRKLRSYHE